MDINTEIIPRPKLLLGFPGQGCQGFIDKSYDDARYWKEIDDTVGFKLSRIVFDKVPVINQTMYAQPAIVAATIQDLKRWEERVIRHIRSIDPDFDDSEIGFLGNSLGEIPAAYAAGFCGREIALRCSAFRGKVMQEAIPEAEERDKTLPFMNVVMNVERGTVEDVCNAVSASGAGIVSPSNYNADVEEYKQIVIAGNKSAVMLAYVDLEERINSGGIVVLTKRKGREPSIKPLFEAPGPFHTETMVSAEQELEKRASDFEFSEEQRVPSGKRYVLFQTYPQDRVLNGKKARYNIIRQMPRAIELCRTIGLAVKEGFKYFFECGPGGSLGSIIKRRGGLKIIKKTDMTE